MSGPRLFLLIGLLSGSLLVACDGAQEIAAPYEGARPLLLRRVTQSYTPDIQWVGGRVAAIGVNRGPRAALDSTLVWLQTADDNSIPSHVTVGASPAAALRQYGGTPVDRLTDGEQYTFWLAEKSALEAGLQGPTLNAFTFADTTLTMRLLLSGNVLGGLGVQMKVTRDERLLGQQFVLDWSPAVPVRRVVLREAPTGGFSEPIRWHVVLPDSLPDSILPPLVLGETPPGAVVAKAWDGFGTGTHTLWMVTSAWDGSFSPRARGYAFFQLFATNFQ